MNTTYEMIREWKNKGIHVLNTIIICNDLKVLYISPMWIECIKFCYEMIRQCQDWEQCCFSDWLHTLKGIVEGMCTCRAHVLEYNVC